MRMSLQAHMFAYLLPLPTVCPFGEDVSLGVGFEVSLLASVSLCLKVVDQDVNSQLFICSTVIDSKPLELKLKPN